MSRKTKPSERFLKSVISILQSGTARGLEPGAAVSALGAAAELMASTCRPEDAKAVREVADMINRSATRLEAAQAGKEQDHAAHV